MKKMLFVLLVLTATLTTTAHAGFLDKKSNTATPAKTQTVKTQKIDLNKADAKTLATAVKGIGEKRATAIVAYRDKHGKFQSLEALAKVKGIGKRFIANNRQVLEKQLMVG